MFSGICTVFLVYNSYDIPFVAVLFLFLFSVTFRFSCMFGLQALQ